MSYITVTPDEHNPHHYLVERTERCIGVIHDEQGAIRSRGRYVAFCWHARTRRRDGIVGFYETKDKAVKAIVAPALAEAVQRIADVARRQVPGVTEITATNLDGLAVVLTARRAEEEVRSYLHGAPELLDRGEKEGFDTETWGEMDAILRDALRQGFGPKDCLEFGWTLVQEDPDVYLIVLPAPQPAA